MVQGFSNQNWHLLASQKNIENMLVEQAAIPRLVARVLSVRGIATPGAAEVFLHPSLERDWHDPLDIPGMRQGADRVERAIRSNERIAVFGDFDVDGMSATALLAMGLKDLGAHYVYPYIPHRFEEGYGLSQEAFNRMLDDGKPDLVITVDNGIAAAHEVESLLAQGIDVVVTDHHEPADLVPRNIPVVDPKLVSEHPSRELAGAGVALKLVQELGRRLDMPGLWYNYTDMATLGTISDMMLLLDENRALVADGIAKMRTCRRPGFFALADIAGVDLTQISSDELPFSLIPRLNAAGRMGNVEVALNLLLTTNLTEAQKLASELELINQERKEAETSMADNVFSQLEKDYHGERAIVVSGEGWHEGVKGIVASRVVNKYHVPALLFSLVDGVARGSGRSVGSVDLFHAVERSSDLLVRFGGHAGAVGVTIEPDKLDAFKKQLLDHMATLAVDEFVDQGEITAEVNLSELDVASISDLEMLQPFGQGNKKPLFLVRGVCMRNRRLVGPQQEHLSFIASTGTTSLSAVKFRVDRPDFAVDYDGAVDLVFEAVAETWQGKTRAKMMVRDILYPTSESSGTPNLANAQQQTSVFASSHEAQSQTSSIAPTIADELFERAHEILARSEYAGIAEAEHFMTKAVGVSFEDRQNLLAKLQDGEELILVRQSDNEHDTNAIALVRQDGSQVGYLRRQIAAELAPVLDEGGQWLCRVAQLTGGDEGKQRGVNLELKRQDVSEESSAAYLAAQQERERLSTCTERELQEELRRAMIGDAPLLGAQKLALERLRQDRSCLCVMATGRGKSLIFHIHAAQEALLHNKASVFVYPLRALVADQAFHLEQSFRQFGIRVKTLTGESTPEERSDTFCELATGTLDIVLTTPEFLSIHTRRFAETGRVGFVVVDEAHHAGETQARSAYGSFPSILEELGRPTVLAVSATASHDIAQEICRLLSIDHSDVIIDKAVRENLSLVDARELRDREAALINTVSRGEKTVVYVNSREQSVALARTLRHALPALAPAIGFYNAALTRQERSAVEEAFRQGKLCCIISTSAFGEGVNLADIRHVMLYHMPFGQVEFNQMSGRAGRDGKPASIHVLFGKRDARINQRILESSAPAREDLVVLYRTLKTLEREALESDEEDFQCTNADIAERAHAIERRTHLDEAAVSCGISVFRELGFLETSGFSVARRIKMASTPQHIELDQSTRYLEGIRSLAEFSDFNSWALGVDEQTMLERINRPITPDFGIEAQ